MPLTFKNWKSHSASKSLRSTQLQEIDQKVQVCSAHLSNVTLKALTAAIITWQRSKGSWWTSHHADHIVDLINLVKQEARRIYADGAGGIFSWVHCEKAIIGLKSAPDSFLRANVLILKGANSGVADFGLDYRGYDPTYHASDLTQRPGRAGRISYCLTKGNGGPQLRAYCIPMHTDITLYSSQNDVEGKFEAVTGASFMLTGGLSGCTFLMRKNQGVLECAHIKPSGCSGAQLQAFLKNLNLAHTTLYGVQDYQVNASIFGAKDSNGDWSIWAQEFDVLNAADKVTGVTRIFRT